MKYEIKNNLLIPATQLDSPHCNDRPPNTPIELVVIHGISLPPGEFGTGVIEDFFCGKLAVTTEAYYEPIKDLKVAAHLLISRVGEITQFVPFDRRAWHAGISTFAGKNGCNDFSIGIELEGTDDVPYEEIQYEQLTAVLRAIMFAYPVITRDRIVGHEDVAPGRKTDPGPSFDWSRLDCLSLPSHNTVT
jgi:AmpD protein